ncbi:MAG: hypothetical protein ACFE9J_05710 [Candidatus Hermodarchaeota archaeon]
MKIDNSNKRYLIVIAGILIISLISIFLAYALGDWDHNAFPNNNPPPNGGLLLTNRENNIVENNILTEVGFLPIAEKAQKSGIDTSSGVIYIADHNIPDTLPLCINQIDVDTWYATIYTHGGYTFEEGKVKVYQGKSDDPWWDKYVGEITILGAGPTAIDVPADLPFDTCGALQVMQWDITFDMVVDPIMLDSNHVPTVYGDGLFASCWDPLPQDLDKYVTLKFYMTWKGCDDEEQEFQIIWAYFCMFLESPTPD